MNERNLKILGHLAVQALLIGLAYNSVNTNDRWHEASQFVLVVLIIIALCITYFVSLIVVGWTGKQSSKTFGKLLWITPLFWLIYWLAHIYISVGIDAYETDQYLAKHDKHQADYKYTHSVLVKNLPEQLSGYQLLNPGDYLINSFKLLSPDGDTLRVTKCIGAAKYSDEYLTTNISFKLPGIHIKDTNLLLQKTINLLHDFSNDTTLEFVNGDWKKFLIARVDTFHRSDRLETTYSIGALGTPEHMGNLSCIKFHRQEEMRFRLTLFNAHCKLCYPITEDPNYKAN